MKCEEIDTADEASPSMSMENQREASLSGVRRST